MATIKLKRGTSAPTTSDIADGEVAIDKSAQKLYLRDGSTIKEIGGSTTGTTLDLSGALTAASAIFTTADNLSQVRLISTDADASAGPRLDLQRNSASPAASDFVGRIRFLAEDSASNETAYAHIDSIISDPTDGSEDGHLRIETKTNGTMQNRIGINSSETVFNEDSISADFRIESDGQANMFFVDASTNRVGINTNTPDTVFEIRDADPVLTIRDTETSSASANATLRLAETGSSDTLNSYWDIKADGGKLQFIDNWQEGGGTGTRMTIADTGNVGILTDSPIAPLHVAGNAVIESGSPDLYLATTSASHANWRIAAQEVVSQGFEIASGTTSASSNAVADTYTTRFTIKNTGLVGIGTTAPTHLLHVNGTAKFGSVGPIEVGTNVLKASNTGNNGFLLRSAISSEGNPSFSSVDDTNTGMFLPSGDILGFTTAGSERMRIDSSGNVGIGTTAPAWPLQIDSDDDLTDFTSTAKGAMMLRNTDYNTGDYTALDFGYSSYSHPIGRIGLKVTGSGSYLAFGTSNSYSSGVTNEAMTIDYNGYVGIGDTAPQSNLDISGSSGIFVRHSTGGSLVLDDSDTADGSTPMVFIRNTAGTLRLGYANRNSSTGLTTGSANTVQIAPTGIVDFINHIDLPDSKYVRLGNDADMILYHDGSASYIQSVKQDGDIFIRGNDGGTNFNALGFDMSNNGAATFNSTVSTSGISVSHSTDNGVNIVANDTTGNSSFSAMRIDYNASGSDTLAGDRAHIGLEFDVDSSATGGNTSEEHRLYSIYSHTRATGDSDLIYGAYFNAEAQHSSGTVSGLYGVYGRAEGDANGGTINGSYGVIGASIVGNSAGVTHSNAYGGYFKTTVVAANADTTVGNLYGAYCEVEIDPPGAADVDVAAIYGVHAVIDNDGATDGSNPSYDLSNTPSYLYYGNYTGTLPGNAYGLYILDDVTNYLRGSLGIGTTNPTRTLMISSDDDLTSFTGTSYGAMYIRNSDYASGEYTAIDFGYNGTQNAVGRIALRVLSGGSRLSFGTSSNYSNGITNEAMTIGPTGLVGIGTDVHGNLLEVAGASPIIEINSTSGVPELQFSDGGTDEFSIMYDTGANALKFVEGGVGTHLTIEDGGKVGIGSTNPAGTLDLGNATNGRGIAWGGSASNAHYASIWTEYGSASIILGAGLKGGTSAATFINPYTGSYGYSAIELDSFSDDGIKFYCAPDSSRTINQTITPVETMRLDTSGNMGLGSGAISLTTPDIVFQIGSSSHTNPTIQSRSSASGTGRLCFGDNSGGSTGRHDGYIQYSQTDRYMQFGTAAGERMRLTSGGSLLVGTNTQVYPSSDLNVGSTSDAVNGLQIQTSTSGSGYVLFGDGTGSNAYRGQLHYHHGSDYLRMVAAGSERLRCDSGGVDVTGALVATGELYLQTSLRVGTELVSEANATVGPGWMSVATNPSGRRIGEIIVTDADSGDHGYIRIDWMRSYADSNFTVLNCGGHSNRITGVRVISDDSNNTYGVKILQVYVTVSSDYEVTLYHPHGISDYTAHTIVTPVIENTKTGYSVHGGQIEDLNAYSLASEEGVQAPAMKTSGIYSDGDSDTYIQFHAANQFRIVTGGSERFEQNQGTTSIPGTLNVRSAIDLADNDILRLGSGDDVEFFCNGSHMYMDLNSGIGNFYIRDDQTVRYTFNDNGSFTATGNITAYSDRRVKRDFEPIENALEKVSQLEGMTYIRTDISDGNRRYAGLIAQDVEKVLPEAVSEVEDHKVLDYNGTIGLLVEAIKELKEEVASLKSKLKDK